MMDDYDYYEPVRGSEPYFLEDDQGYGSCPECGSALENWGAVSNGDGDLYDEIGCPLCQEARGRANESWFDGAGNKFDSEDEMQALGEFPEEDEVPGWDCGVLGHLELSLLVEQTGGDLYYCILCDEQVFIPHQPDPPDTPAALASDIPF